MMKIIVIFLSIILFLHSSIKCQEDLNDLKDHVNSICEEPNHKHYPQITLGYITPWNLNGLELILKYSAKFDIVSPCWFDIKPEILQGKYNTKIEGANYINNKFIKELKEIKPEIKILPRFRCEGFSAPTFEEMLKEENIDQFLKIFMRRMKYNKFDGMVFECNPIWLMDNLYANFTSLLRKLYEELKKEQKTLILTIFPYSESFTNHLSKIRFEYVSKYTDYFNVMTYDYISYLKLEKSTPISAYNAPISWIKKTLDFYIDSKKPNKDDLNKKILLGLPFHGYLVEKGSDQPKIGQLDSNSFSNIVSSGEVSNFQWDKVECEHMIEMVSDNRQTLAIYPTKKFFKERLDFSKNEKLGGVAIWDLAQGIESFLDEF